MRILHFIPDINISAGSNIFKYKPALLERMSGNAEVHLLTFCPVREPLSGVTVHKMSSLKMILDVGSSSLYNILSGIKPDIVHIHACWSFAAYKLQKLCVKKRIPVVLTLDKQLEPWHVHNHYYGCKLLRLLLFQRAMIRKADAIQAVSEQEKTTVEHLGWHPSFVSRKCLNDRTAVIRIFSLVEAMPIGDMVAAMIRLYRKVLDTRPFMSMTDADCRAEDFLLALGMSKDNDAVALSDEDKSFLLSLDVNSWRRILLHAVDEGIYDTVKSGCMRCAIFPPPMDVYTADRFASSVKSAAGLEKGRVDKYNVILKRNKTLSGIELDICKKLVDVLSKIKCLQVKRSDIAGLYQSLRYTDYNETLVATAICTLRMQKVTSRLFQIMKERYGLEEGFMFLEPLSDRKTQILRNNLFKSDIQ